MSFHGADGEPSDLISRLCLDLLDRAGESVPVDIEVLASFRNAHVTHVDQEQPETIHWDGRNFQIQLRSSDTPGRRRFSCAHAIIHTWFFESSGHGLAGPKTEQGWSEVEEELCDLGAAALLLPEGAFRAGCRTDVTIDDVLYLAGEFQASAEATALRAVALSPTPLAMVVLEVTLSLTQQKMLASQRSGITPSGSDGPTISPCLRVVKSFGHGLRYLPRYKSVGDCTLASVLDVGAADYVGEIGIVPGIYRASARNLPIRRGGELVDRVVALIAPYG